MYGESMKAKSKGKPDVYVRTTRTKTEAGNYAEIARKNGKLARVTKLSGRWVVVVAAKRKDRTDRKRSDNGVRVSLMKVPNKHTAAKAVARIMLGPLWRGK